MPPPHHGQPPFQLFCWGEVTICVLPLVWHCVVFGAVVVHCGVADATGASATVAQAPAAAKSVLIEQILVPMVGLLNGPRKNPWLATTSAAATDNQRWT